MSFLGETKMFLSCTQLFLKSKVILWKDMFCLSSLLRSNSGHRLLTDSSMATHKASLLIATSKSVRIMVIGRFPFLFSKKHFKIICMKKIHVCVYFYMWICASDGLDLLELELESVVSHLVRCWDLNSGPL